MLSTLREIYKGKDLDIQLFSFLKKKFPGKLRQLEILPVLARVSMKVATGIKSLIDDGKLDRLYTIEHFFSYLLKASNSEISSFDQETVSKLSRYG